VFIHTRVSPVAPVSRLSVHLSGLAPRQRTQQARPERRGPAPPGRRAWCGKRTRPRPNARDGLVHTWKQQATSSLHLRTAHRILYKGQGQSRVRFFYCYTSPASLCSPAALPFVLHLRAFKPFIRRTVSCSLCTNISPAQREVSSVFRSVCPEVFPPAHEGGQPRCYSVRDPATRHCYGSTNRGSTNRASFLPHRDESRER
jgi:hypothetical protein